MSPLFIEHLAIVTQNFETNFLMENSLVTIPIILDNVTLPPPQTCSVSVIIPSNTDEKRLDRQHIL